MVLSPSLRPGRRTQDAGQVYNSLLPQKEIPMADLSTVFTGLKFENPFLLSSAPPTESDSNIMRAFEAGWAGVVTKTIGLHPVVNVRGPKTKFIRATPESYHLAMEKRPGAALHSS